MLLAKVGHCSMYGLTKLARGWTISGKSKCVFCEYAQVKSELRSVLASCEVRKILVGRPHKVIGGSGPEIDEAVPGKRTCGTSSHLCGAIPQMGNLLSSSRAGARSHWSRWLAEGFSTGFCSSIGELGGGVVWYIKCRLAGWQEQRYCR